MLIASFLLVFFIYNTAFSQQAFVNTGGPFTPEILTTLVYSDSVIFISRKNMGVYKSTDIGNNWYKANTGISRNEDILSFCKYHNIIIAGSSNGKLYFSFDLGQTWGYSPAINFGKIYSIYITTNEYLFLGSDKGVWRSTNGGMEWELKNSTDWGTDLKVFKISASSTGFLFCNREGTLYKSTNYGNSWYHAGSGTNDFFIAQNNIIYKSFYTNVYKSTNHGFTWTMLAGSGLHSSGSISAITVSSDNIIFVGYTSPVFSGVYRSTNGGSNFTGLGLLTPNIFELDIMADKYLFATTNNGVYRNDNMRTSSSFNHLTNGLNYPPITKIENNNYVFYAYTDSMGAFSYTGTSETKWLKAFTTLPESVNVVTSYIKLPNLIILGTKNSGVIVSTNSGNTWLFSSMNPLDTAMVSFIDGSNPNNIFCGTRYQGLFRSTDSGMSWIKLTNNLPQDIILRTLKRSNDGTYYLAAENYKVYKSSDNGQTWQQASYGLPNDIVVMDLSIYANNYLMLCSKNYGIFKTIDGGQNWFQSNLGLPANAAYNQVIYYPTALVMSQNKIYRSLNFGDNWFSFITLSNGNVTSMVVYGANTKLYFSSDNGSVYESYHTLLPVELKYFNGIYLDNSVKLIWQTASETNNFGFEIERKTVNSDWRVIGFKAGKGTTTIAQEYEFIDNLFEVNSTKLYYRLKQIDFDGSFEYSNEIEVEVTPSAFELYQNYPNPFNPSTKISFTIPNVGTGLALTVLKVYDALGNEVATLLNEYKPAGRYEVEFDANVAQTISLCSGVYYYQLKAGDFVQTKKMILMR